MWSPVDFRLSVWLSVRLHTCIFFSSLVFLKNNWTIVNSNHAWNATLLPGEKIRKSQMINWQLSIHWTLNSFQTLAINCSYARRCAIGFSNKWTLKTEVSRHRNSSVIHGFEGNCDIITVYSWGKWQRNWVDGFTRSHMHGRFYI